MPRESVKITLTTIARVLRMAQAGDTADYEIADVVVPGLFIRIRKRSAKWALRFRVGEKQYYFTIGTVLVLGDPDLVRKAAERAKAMVREGRDPSSLFSSLLQAPTLEAAESRAAHLAGQVWAWTDARQRWLADSQINNRPDTVRTYRSATGLVDLAFLNDKVITDITPNDIRRARDSIRSRGKIAQSKLTMRALKAAFGWLAEQSESGLKTDPTLGVATSVKERPAMLVDAIAAAEALVNFQAEEVLPEEQLRLLEDELDGAKPASARLALKLGLRTLQRRLTVVSALKASFMPHESYGMVWCIHPGTLKVGRNRDGQMRRHPHVLPLTAPTQKIVRTALALSQPDNPFLFPQLRLRRAGDSGKSHLSERLLNSAIADLQKSGGALYHVQKFTMHDWRAWFTTHMNKRGFNKDHIKFVLDHSEARRADTTDQHYNWEQKLPEKFSILCAWDQLIDSAKATITSGLPGQPLISQAASFTIGAAHIQAPPDSLP